MQEQYVLFEMQLGACVEQHFCPRSVTLSNKQLLFSNGLFPFVKIILIVQMRQTVRSYIS